MNTLQAGRAIACLAVLLFHTNVTLVLPKYLGRDVFPIFNAGASGVQFFFVLSGFVILLAHERDIGDPSKLGTFLWKRFRRVYPPLWVVLLLVLPVYFLVSSYGAGGERSLQTIVAAFVLSPTPKDYLLTPAWTLRHEVLFYLIFSLLIWKRSIGISVGAAWLALCAIVPLLHLSFPWNFFFTTNHFLFAFGMVACLAFQRRKFHLRAAYVAAPLGAALFASVWFVDLARVVPESELMNLLYGLGATLMVLGLVVMERDGGLEVPAVLVLLGEASYSIYLVHFPAVSAAIKIAVPLGRHARLPDAVIFFASAAAALTAGLLFHLAVEKPLLTRLTTPRFLSVKSGRAHTVLPG